MFAAARRCTKRFFNGAAGVVTSSLSAGGLHGDVGEEDKEFLDLFKTLLRREMVGYDGFLVARVGRT